jgi:Flp pilus assembly protein TadD
MRGAAAWLVAAAFGCAADLASARDWLEARIDDFVLVTDAQEPYARGTLRDFAVFKHALGALAPLTREVPHMPTEMYALEGGDWRGFATSPNTQGFFAERIDRNYIFFDRTPSGLLSREVVFHEYMHFVLHSGASVFVPPWWDEGVAELFSSLRERDGKIEFGLVPNARKDDFRYLQLMPTRTLFAADRSSQALRKHVSAPMFYAQSWLTVHYMLIEKPERGRQTETYLNLVSAGKPTDEAVQAAYGVSLDELDKEIRSYRNKGRIGAYLMKFKTPLPNAQDVVIRALPEAVALSRLSIAGSMLGSGVGDAEKRAQRALRIDPALPLAHAALALVRLTQERIDEALELSRKVLASPADPHAAVVAARVQHHGVLHALYASQPKAPAGETAAPGAQDGEADGEQIDDAILPDGERPVPSPEQSQLLQTARTAVLPFTDDPDHGIGATLTVATIDQLLQDRKPEETLLTVQRAVSKYPTHPELAEIESLLCVAAGRTTAALASASRAARYARSPEARYRLEGWVQELEAAGDPSR